MLVEVYRRRAEQNAPQSRLPVLSPLLSF